MKSSWHHLRFGLLLSIALTAVAGSFLTADERPSKPVQGLAQGAGFETDPALPAGAKDHATNGKMPEPEVAADDENVQGKKPVAKARDISKFSQAEQKKLKERPKKRGKYSIYPQLDGAFARALQIQDKHTPKLMAQKGVNGTGLGLGTDNQPALRVYYSGADEPKLPQKIDGVPVQLVKRRMIFRLADRVKAGTGQGSNNKNSNSGKTAPIGQASSGKSTGRGRDGKGLGRNASRFDNQFPSDYWNRPTPIGISTSPIVADCYYGTLGCRVIRKSDPNNVYALSNNHVFADLNKATIGTTVITQPATGDYICGISSSVNRVGILADYVVQKFGGVETNTVDAAIALMDPDTLSYSTPPDGYGSPLSTISTAVVGDVVMKYGRTTGFTIGEVTALNVTAPIGDPEDTATLTLFIKMVEITGFSGNDFSAAGDSGSLIVDYFTRQPTALLFAGNSLVTYANPIDLVLEALNLEFPVAPADSGDFVLEVPGKRGRPANTVVVDSFGQVSGSKSKKGK